MKQNISKKYSLILIIFLVLVTVGLTYSFFAGSITGIFSNDAIVTSNTTDLLTFQIDNDIDFEVSQQDFVSGGNNKSGYTNARAILVPNNKTGNATMNYYMYLNIENNQIDYSSTNTNELPELMLQLYDGNNELVTIDYLDEMVTVKGVTGYDITGFEGLIPLLDNQEIVATNNTQTTQEWKVVVTLINLDINQNDNTGKELIAEVIMQKDPYTPGGNLAGNLASVVKNEIIPTSLMKEYRGEGYYHDESDKDTEHPYFTRPIYYWDATSTSKLNEVKNNWNVVFGGSCWQIFRTTDNEGVKLLYNGEPIINIDDVGQINYDCSNNRSNNFGIDTRAIVSFSDSYYYSDLYEYNSNTKKFILVNPDNEKITMKSSNGNSLEGKYTCKSSISDASCDTLYYIDEYISDSSAYAISFINTENRDIIGNSSYNINYESLSSVGYMYGDVYSGNSRILNNIDDIQISGRDNGQWIGSIGANTSINFFGERGYIYDRYFSDGYILDGTNTSLSGTPQTALSIKENSANGDYSDLVGKYTLFSNSATKSANQDIAYIIGVNGTTIYYVASNARISDPATNDDIYKMSNNLIDNNDGTYTLDNPTNVHRFDWWNIYSNYVGYYVCSDYISTTCSYSNMVRISSTRYDRFRFDLPKYNTQYTLATSVTKNGNNYVLNNPITIGPWEFANNDYSNYYLCVGSSPTCSASDLRYIINYPTANWSYGYATINLYSNKFTYNNGIYTLDMTNDNAINLPEQLDGFNAIGKAHYTCFNTTGTCSEINYVYSFQNNNAIYITLADGKYVSTDESNQSEFKSNDNALYSMLHTNTNNSTIKDTIDWWYKTKLINYSEYIDGEEIYCNDKRTNNNYGSWNLNANNISTDINFINNTILNSGPIRGNINCYYKEDSYSAEETTHGNGDLTYPIGLLTVEEAIIMLNVNDPKKLGESKTFWFNDPLSFGSAGIYSGGIVARTYSGGMETNTGASGMCMGSGTNCYSFAEQGGVRRNLGVRPSIALPSSSLEYSQGDGSTTNPYVISVGNSITLNDINYKASKKKAVQGEKITITNNKYIVGSFKLNGTTIIGNTFIMPDEDVEITDIKVYKIKNNSNNDNILLPSSAIPGKNVSISFLNNQGYTINSFKLNGVLVNGNTFIMPQENAIITDIVVEDALSALRNNPNYEILDYLILTGTQYIDPEYPIWKDGNWKIEYKFDVSQHYNYNNMLGFSTVTDTNNEVWIDSNGDYIVRFPNTGRQVIQRLSLNTPYTITHDNTGSNLLSYINGELISTLNRANTNSNNNVSVAHRSGGNYLKGNMYYIKFWSNDELVRWLIPVIKKTTGVPGMYDVVNGVFYQNAGTGNFGVPEKNITESNLIGLITAFDNNQYFTKKLYLESSGNQYINTGISADANTNMEIDFQYLGTSTSKQWVALCGVKNPSFAFWIDKNSKQLAPQNGNWDPSENSLFPSINTTDRYVMKNVGLNYYLNGSLIESAPNPFTSNDSKIHIFVLGDGSNIDNRNAQMRVYSFKISNNSTNKIIRYMIPCVRNSDNVAGMYDVVNDIFYTNQGTGTFTVPN